MSLFGYQTWTQDELMLLYNLRVNHPSLTWEQITTMYQTHVSGGRNRTSDALAAKWRNTCNGQQATSPNEDTATFAISRVTCDAQTSQEARGPWVGLGTDSIAQGNPLETEIWQGGHLATGSDQAAAYSQADSSEQGPNLFLPSSVTHGARGNDECLNDQQQVSSLPSKAGGGDTDDEDVEILLLKLEALDTRMKLRRLQKKLEGAQLK